MKIYKLIPSHNILTSFSHREAKLLVELIEHAQTGQIYEFVPSKAETKRLSSMKRSLIKIAHTKVRK